MICHINMKIIYISLVDYVLIWHNDVSYMLSSASPLPLVGDKFKIIVGSYENKILEPHKIYTITHIEKESSKYLKNGAYIISFK
jgi:hypothetical protein